MSDANNLATVGAAASYTGVATKGTAVVAFIGWVFITAVVMAMTAPKTRASFFVAIISTAAFSFGGGAFLIDYLNLTTALFMAPTKLHFYLVLIKMGSTFFVAGLPGWVVIRAIFVFTEARKTDGIDAFIHDVRNILKPDSQE